MSLLKTRDPVSPNITWAQRVSGGVSGSGSGGGGSALTPGSRAVSHVERLSVAQFFKDQSVTAAHSSSGSATSADECEVGVADPNFFDKLHVQWAKGGEDKESASASVVIEAILRAAGDPHVFIKLSFGDKHDALYYERIIYCRVTQRLLTQQLTPCVVPYLGYVRVNAKLAYCLDSTAARSGGSGMPPAMVCDAIKSMSAHNVSKGRNPLTLQDIYHGHALITEVSRGGVTLRDWQQDSHSVEEWQDVLFQLVYTLEVFAQIKLTHWDLHSGNVFVQDAGSNTWTIWLLERGVARVMRTRWLVKIYDFDRSAKLAAPGVLGFEEPIRNRAMQKRNWLSAYGGQGTWDPCVDYVRVVDAVLRRPAAIPDKILRVLSLSLDLGLLARSRLSWQGTLCYKPAPPAAHGVPCVIDPQRSAAISSTPADLLRQLASGDAFAETMLGRVVSVEDAKVEYRMRQIHPFKVFALPLIRDELNRFVASAASKKRTYEYTSISLGSGSSSGSNNSGEKRRRHRSRSKSPRSQTSPPKQKSRRKSSSWSSSTAKAAAGSDSSFWR